MPALERALIRPARRADAEAVARVHATSWAESYPPILGAAASRPDAFARRRAVWTRRLARPQPGGEVFVAELAGEIVGFGACGPQREDDRPWDGEFYCLYLLGRAHGHGFGRRLMAAMARRMLDWGAQSADVWALSGAAQACGFYAALGGRPDVERAFSLGGRRVMERAFVWPDLGAAPFATANEV
jgi:GNAT superfamily N-acetyltransferase